MPWDDPFYDDDPGDVYPPFTEPGGDGLTDVTGNEHDPYEEGYQGGDSDGSTGSPTNPNSPNFDWAALLKPFLGAAGAAGGAGGKSSNPLDALLRSLGLTGKDGGLDLSGLLGLAGLITGNVNQKDAIKDATARMEAAAEKSNAFAMDKMGGAAANFQPYIAAGQGALQKMVDFDKTPLSSMYKATGGNAPSNLAGQFKATPTMGDFARLTKG